MIGFTNSAFFYLFLVQGGNAFTCRLRKAVSFWNFEIASLGCRGRQDGRDHTKFRVGHTTSDDEVEQEPHKAVCTDCGGPRDLQRRTNNRQQTGEANV